MKLCLLFGQHPIIVIGKYYSKNTCYTIYLYQCCYLIINVIRCGNVAAILELSETLQRDFTIFEAAPQENRGMPTKKHAADYFL